MTRRINDAYFTTDGLVTALRSRVEIAGQVVEPANGYGAISRHFPGCLTNDINSLFPADWNEDAAAPEFWDRFHCWPIIAAAELHKADWVVTNPPFNRAFDMLRLAWPRVRVGIAMLLRITFEEPTKERGLWLAEHSAYLSDEIVFGQPRPCFTDDGRTDSATVKWFVWRKRNAGKGTRKHYVFNWLADTLSES